MNSDVTTAAPLERVSLTALPGWANDDHAAALEAFRLSCHEMREAGSGFRRPVRYGGSLQAWLDVCTDAFAAVQPRHFFEDRFNAYRVEDPSRPEGLFTGYYEPDVLGSRTPSEVFNVPIYRRPADLVAFSEAEQTESGLAFGRMVDGKPSPYFTRREIEDGVLAGKGLVLVYLAHWADAFFIHIQGSGRVRLEDNTILRLTYAAKSGLPYSGIGSLLAERGELRREDLSMQAIRSWMERHPAQARALMWENQSFIFFREACLERPELGALGAQHVQLTPRRSLAVDRSLWMFGTPVWLDTEIPAGDEGGMTAFQQLLIAQDTGSAIKGAVRGDVFWGFGEEAARIAGPMKSPGSMVVLLPAAVADELGLP